MLLMILLSIIIWKTGLGEICFFYILDMIPIIKLPKLELYLKVFTYHHTTINILQRLLILLPLIYFYPSLSKEKTFSTLFNIYFWGTVVYLTFGFFGLFIARINMFFRILEIILIPILYEKVKNKNQKIIIQVPIVAWGLTVLTWVYYKEAYYPFKTIFGDIL